MTVAERIDRVNKKLSDMGSIFRADEDFVILGYVGSLTFLRRKFNSLEELETYVERCRVAHEKGVMIHGN